jgi:hypothetical protein
MRKEILVAVLAGILFGLIIAFGVWRVNSALSPKEGQLSSDSSSQNDEPSVDLALAKPANNQVVTTSTVTISGVTKANSLVGVSAEEFDYLTRANPQGEFSEEIKLVGGINQINISAFEATGQKVEQKLTLIYSSEFSKFLTQADGDSVEATDETEDSIRTKVQEKITEALENPIAYLGTVTDLAEGTIQIKSAAGEIHQAATTAESVVIADGASPKQVKLTDIAIGDFIVAMGFTNGNHVLDAKRILITSEPETSSRGAILARTSEVATRQITLIKAGGQDEVILTPNANSLYFLIENGEVAKSRLSEIEEGSLVVVFTEADSKSTQLRTLFAITTP